MGGGGDGGICARFVLPISLYLFLVPLSLPPHCPLLRHYCPFSLSPPSYSYLTSPLAFFLYSSYLPMYLILHPPSTFLSLTSLLPVTPSSSPPPSLPVTPSSPPPSLPPSHPLPPSVPLTPSSPPSSLPPSHPSLPPCHPLLTPSLPSFLPVTPSSPPSSLPPSHPLSPSLSPPPHSLTPSLFVTPSLSLTPSLPPSLQVLSKGSRQALVAMLNTTKGVDPKEEKRSKVKVEADAVINFRQLAVGADEQAEVRGPLQSW